MRIAYQLFAIIGLMTGTWSMMGGQTDPDLTGLQFRNIGPATMSGRIVDLAVVEKNPYTFYVASATGGVWKTYNNGVTFTPVFEKENTHSVGDIAVHQRDTQWVWVGTGERANRQSSSWGDGVYRSKDGGDTWQHMGLEESHHIGRIVLHPTDTNRVYVAAMGHLWGPNEMRGLYETKDGGNTWTPILQIDENTGVVDVAMDPSNPNILYAATYQRRRRPYGFHGGGPGSGLYKSIDGGVNWEKIHQGFPEGDLGRIGISIFRKNPEVVYISVEQGIRYNASTAYEKRKAGVYKSTDRGASWIHMGDWNPRPMYASQPLVDPVDVKRVYMMNAFSYSDDHGKTFKTPRQSLHSDDRILWINPNDNRHLIKGDDGGVGISYDRGVTWLYLTQLPVSQFYRVSVDMREPYWVYGGLQDNGSWMGPNATYRREGILNQDWIKTGGGDGFVNLIHPEKSQFLYGESQYLGLFKMDIKSGERRSIRPGDPKGKIRARRNWDAWGPGVPEPEFGNAMAPANWDGPFCFSPHHAQTIYAGTNKLWRSDDGGDSWVALEDLTTGVNRRTLKIMDQRPDSLTLSLDDGIPYYPTLTVIAESPVQEGLLFVGTDDGNFQMSKDGGTQWENLTDQLPGLPRDAWISGIEPSKFDASIAYMVANNYRNDDFKNYLYMTNDGGLTWQSIEGNLPTHRVCRIIREDLHNSELLYLGTELGLFISFDQGQNWVDFQQNMPMVAINDLAIHPRDNDLIVGTHGRGIWILDQLNALQEWQPEDQNPTDRLFSISPVPLIRYRRTGSHNGDMIFLGENPPNGAIIDYRLIADTKPDKVTLQILDTERQLLRKLRVDTNQGMHRLIWDGRHSPLKSLPRSGTASRRRGRSIPGPLVAPGRYVAQLNVNENVYEQVFIVKDDPRLKLNIESRKAWTNDLLTLKELYNSVVEQVIAVRKMNEQIDSLKSSIDERFIKEVQSLKELLKNYEEITTRIITLYGQVEGWTGPMTNDQHLQLAYYQNKSQSFATKFSKFKMDVIPALNKKLKKLERIEVK